MSVVPDFPSSYPGLRSIFVMVLGQCGQPPIREAQFFELVESQPGSGQWETEGGYPLHVYTLKLD